MASDDRKIEIEESAREVGVLVGESLPPGIGFCLVLFTFGDGGWSSFISNAQRNDMIAALEEMIGKLKNNEVEPPS